MKEFGQFLHSVDYDELNIIDVHKRQAMYTLNFKVFSSTKILFGI